MSERKQKPSPATYKVPFTLRLCPKVLAELQKEKERTGLTLTRIVENALRQKLSIKKASA